MIHIMMATYNGEKYIKEQINSILAQTYTDWKLYISDDGSTDKTVNIIKEYERQYPEKIFVVSSEKKFHSAKKNFSYLFHIIPKAEYYAFCDQDDIWEKNKLSKLLTYVMAKQNNEKVLVYHDMKLGSTKQKVFSNSFFEYSGFQLNDQLSLQQILLYNIVPGCSMLFNHKVRECIKEIPEACIMHDWWVLLVTICFGGQIIFCKETLSLYRQHEENQIGATKKKNMLQMVCKCFHFIKFKYYIENNHRLKKERLIQTNAILECYKNEMEMETEYLVNNFIKILTSKNKIFAYKFANKNGYVLYSKLYTIKFYFL